MRQTKSYIFILFSVLLLANCQPDIETVPIVNETKRRVVKAEDIPKVTSTLLGKLGLSNGTQRLAMNSSDVQSEFEIDWDKILQSIDSVGGQTYTFNVSPSEQDPTIFYNLVIKFTPDGSPYKPFLMKYELDSAFATTYLFTGSLENFVGLVTKIPLSSSNLSGGDYDVNLGPNNVRMVSSDPDCPTQTIFDSSDGSSGGGPGSLSGPGTGGTGGTYVTVQRCDYYLVKNPYDTYVEGQYSSSDFYYTMEEDCYEYSYYSHTESPDGSNCDTGDGEVPILLPPGADDWEQDICESESFIGNDCVQGIWEIMKQNNVAFNNLGSFLGERPIAELCLDIQNLNDPTRDVQANGNTALSGSTIKAKVTITLNSQSLNRSKLGIARTILHETVHAELYAMIVEANGKDALEEYIAQNPQKERFQLIWEYINEFPPTTSAAGWQHEFMADYYLTSMVESMRELSSDLVSDSYKNDIAVDPIVYPLNGDAFPWNWNDFYIALSWVALKKTTEWDKLSDDLKSKYDAYTRQYEELEDLSAKCS